MCDSKTNEEFNAEYMPFYDSPLAINSSREHGASYDKFYPLSATSLDQQLRFQPFDAKNSYSPISLVTDTNTYPEGGSIVFSGLQGQGQLQIKSPLAQNAGANNNLTLVPSAIFGGDMTYAAQGPNCSPKPCAVWSPGQGNRLVSLPWNLNLTQNNSNILLCQDERALNGQVVTTPPSEINTPPGTTTPTIQEGENCLWRTDPEIFACCTMGPGNNKLAEYLGMCGNKSFRPGKPGSLCPQYMMELCKCHWDDETDGPCQRYLQNYIDNPDVGTVVQDTIRNYINKRAKDSGCGTNDYTSPLVQGADACRDDSKDPFISKTLITLCSAIAPSHNGNCDQILDQYCAEFTRDDLLKDPTLQTICGCHLSTSSTPPSNVGLNLAGKNQNNQYKYPGMTKACDPVCAFSGTIQTNGAPCSQTVCIMDNISISEMSSTNCDTTINQICGQDKGGQAIGNCYISNVDISAINSDCGGIFLHQNCQNCFSFDPGTEWNNSTPANATRINCANPTGGGGGNGGGGDSPEQPKTGFFAWLKAHPFYVVGILILIAFLIFMIVFFIYKDERSENVVEE